MAVRASRELRPALILDTKPSQSPETMVSIRLDSSEVHEEKYLCEKIK